MPSTVSVCGSGSDMASQQLSGLLVVVAFAEADGLPLLSLAFLPHDFQPFGAWPAFLPPSFQQSQSLWPGQPQL